MHVLYMFKFIYVSVQYTSMWKKTDAVSVSVTIVDSYDLQVVVFFENHITSMAQNLEFDTYTT